MENYVLIDNADNSYAQLDSCYAKSLTSAQIEFSMRGWVIGDVMPLSLYHNLPKILLFKPLTLIT